MDHSLTIVLPVHNAERRIRRNVARVLDVAAELTPCFEVLIVDDGSTDDSYDIASELAAEYPQVAVARSRLRRGLGATLQDVKRRAVGRVVIVHDGVSPVDAEQLRALWRAADEETSLDDLRGPARTHAAMVAAHDRLRGFHLMAPGAEAQGSHAARRPARRAGGPSNGAANIGMIPPLPKPNFMDALGDFARGE